MILYQVECPGQAPDGGLGDALGTKDDNSSGGDTLKCKRCQRSKSLLNLDVVTKDLAVPLSSSLAKSLPSLSASRHPGSAS